MRLMPPAAMKALRQPHISPIHAPMGAAHTVATDTPVRMKDMARANSEAGTSRMASAADMDQKPPRAMPSATRATSSVGRLLARAERAFDSTSITVKASITHRRSMRRVSSGSEGAATAATSAVTVTAWPAAPSLTRRSLAIAVSRLAGRNSAVTRPNTPSAMEATAVQRASVGSAAGGGGLLGAASARAPAGASRQVEQEGDEDTGKALGMDGRPW